MANHPQLPPMNQILVVYKECLHNHIALHGGYILDGCGEFAASGPPDTTGFFVCAACQCHRSFHRKLAIKIPIPAPHHQNDVGVVSNVPQVPNLLPQHPIDSTRAVRPRAHRAAGVAPTTGRQSGSNGRPFKARNGQDI